MNHQTEQFKNLHEFFTSMATNAKHSAQIMETLFPDNPPLIGLWKEKAEIWKDAADKLDTTCALCNIFLRTEPIETKSDRSILLVTSEKY